MRRDSYASDVFKDVLPRNHLPLKITYPATYIINNKKENHEGEHWIAFYFDENKNCDFFDSFGKGLQRIVSLSFNANMLKMSVIIKLQFKANFLFIVDIMQSTLFFYGVEI